MTNYRDDIAALRQEAAERQVRLAEETAKATLGEIEEYQQYAAEALQSGDKETALSWAESINEAEVRLQQELAALPPQPAPELSEATQTWIEGRDDLRGKPNFLFPHLTNDQTAVYVDGFLRSKGIPEGSPEYLESLSRVVDPVDYQPMPTADDVLKEINKTSKYGKVSAAEYNRNVEKMLVAKKAGSYPDR